MALPPQSDTFFSITMESTWRGTQTISVSTALFARDESALSCCETVRVGGHAPPEADKLFQPRRSLRQLAGLELVRDDRFCSHSETVRAGGRSKQSLDFMRICLRWARDYRRSAPRVSRRGCRPVRRTLLLFLSPNSCFLLAPRVQCNNIYKYIVKQGLTATLWLSSLSVVGSREIEKVRILHIDDYEDDFELTSMRLRQLDGSLSVTLYSLRLPDARYRRPAVPAGDSEAG